MSQEPTYRRPLNTHQLAILNTLYKFRFVTATLLTKNQEAKHIRVISNRLKILVEQEYIGMNYDSSYKIKGMPATYFLLPRGVRYLREQPYTNESALRSIYQDKRAIPSRIQHRLNIFKLYIQLKQAYPGRFKFYSKTELINKPHVPKTKPDAYFVDTLSNEAYFLDYFEDTTNFWALKKAIKRYIAFAELGIWYKYMSDKPHPRTLLVCESSQMKRKVENLCSKELDSSFVELEFLVTTIEVLAEEIESQPVIPDQKN